MRDSENEMRDLKLVEEQIAIIAIGEPELVVSESSEDDCETWRQHWLPMRMGAILCQIHQ